jgi:uncharacterized membrane protein YqaE (UPF0057 family)
MAGLCLKVLLIFVSLILPPLAVWIARNKVCSGTVFINILLTLLGIVCISVLLNELSFFFFSKVPGTIHAWCVICCCDNLD